MPGSAVYCVCHGTGEPVEMLYRQLVGSQSAPHFYCPGCGRYTPATTAATVKADFLSEQIVVTVDFHGRTRATTRERMMRGTT